MGGIHGDKILFRQKKWDLGIITSDIVDFGSGVITRAPNNTFDDISLTMPLSLKAVKNWDARLATDWGKRKIIHNVKIDVEKNCPGNEAACSFSIVQVKKKVIDWYLVGSWVDPVNGLVSTEQMITDPTQFPKFNDNINIDMPWDEDLVLIDNVNLNNDAENPFGVNPFGVKRDDNTNKTIRTAEAIKDHITYDITIIYSNGRVQCSTSTTTYTCDYW